MVGFKIYGITRGKEGDFIVKGTAQQKNIIILNVHVENCIV